MLNSAYINLFSNIQLVFSFKLWFNKISKIIKTLLKTQGLILKGLVAFNSE